MPSEKKIDRAKARFRKRHGREARSEAELSSFVQNYLVASDFAGCTDHNGTSQLSHSDFSGTSFSSSDYGSSNSSSDYGSSGGGSDYGSSGGFSDGGGGGSW